MDGLSQWILDQLQDMEIRELMSKPDADLMALWDRYDGTNQPSGFSGESIHLALNKKGLGSHCPV